MYIQWSAFKKSEIYIMERLENGLPGCPILIFINNFMRPCKNILATSCLYVVRSILTSHTLQAKQWWPSLVKDSDWPKPWKANMVIRVSQKKGKCSTKYGGIYNSNCSERTSTFCISNLRQDVSWSVEPSRITCSTL